MVATADPPVAPTNLGIPFDVPPWLDTGTTLHDTQDSSQSLLSRTQAPDSDRFFPVTSTRGHSTTTAAAAFLPPESVGVPQEGPPNAYAALDDASLVATPDRNGDELRLVAGTAATDSESIKALLDKLFDEFFGPDSPPAPTPLRIKGLFDAGARLVDRFLSNINKEHQRHATCTNQQFTSIKELELFTRGALRADITLLRTETGDTLGPAINTLAGLAAFARKLEQDVTRLMETSARAT